MTYKFAQCGGSELGYLNYSLRFLPITSFELREEQKMKK